MLNLMGIAAKGLMGRELVVRTEEVEDFRAMEASSNSVGEVVFSESLISFPSSVTFLGC